MFIETNTEAIIDVELIRLFSTHSFVAYLLNKMPKLLSRLTVFGKKLSWVKIEATQKF